ncbi:hypothetical protein EDD17DRAFT_1522351 [Pisolithus thermaeus]|nr:hypothetical protein EDD17DRAFT_1522351 [Pisolithus thermaeus]
MTTNVSSPPPPRERGGCRSSFGFQYSPVRSGGGGVGKGAEGSAGVQVVLVVPLLVEVPLSSMTVYASCLEVESAVKSTLGSRFRRQRGDRWRVESRDRSVACLAVFLVEVAIPVALGSTRVKQIMVVVRVQISGWASDLRPAAVAHPSNLNGL